MTTTKIDLGVTTVATFFDGFSAAMTAQYGAAYSVLFQDSSYLVFRCTTLTDKFFMFYKGGTSYSSEFSVGDGWVSGSTLTNRSVLANNTSDYPSAKVLFTAPNFFCLTSFSGYYSKTFLVAKDTIGNALTINRHTDTNGSLPVTSKYLTTNESVSIVETNTGFFGADGSIYKTNSFLKDATTNQLFLDGSGNRIHIEGVQIACLNQPYTTPLYLDSTFISPGTTNATYAGIKTFRNSLLIPYV